MLSMRSNHFESCVGELDATDGEPAVATCELDLAGDPLNAGVAILNMTAPPRSEPMKAPHTTFVSSPTIAEAGVYKIP